MNNILSLLLLSILCVPALAHQVESIELETQNKVDKFYASWSARSQEMINKISSNNRPLEDKIKSLYDHHLEFLDESSDFFSETSNNLSKELILKLIAVKNMRESAISNKIREQIYKYLNANRN